MKELSKGIIESLKRSYPAGTRIKLIHMNDNSPLAPGYGTEGVVSFVDSIGTIHVKWDNGSCLGLIYGVDRFEVIESK